MIFTERTIKMSNDVCQIDNPIVLYRGDHNVEIRFTIIECPYKYSTKNSTNIIETVDASYGQLVIKVPNDGSPIFSDVVETNEGSVVFTISGEMIDESIEVGDYTFQIRLFDANKESRATIPPVENGISIREPIAFEDVTTTNEVGEATVGYALTTAAAPEDAFNSEGNYNKTTWGTGDRITAAKLNKIEAGIDGVNKKVVSAGTSGGSNINDTTASATTTYSSNKIENIKEALVNKLKSLRLVAGDNNTIKLMLGDLELSSITISGGAESGGNVEKPIYGNLVFDNTFLKVQPNGTAQIGIKLDTKPTQNQVVTIAENSDILTIDKTSLTFTPSNYDAYQYITVTVGDVSQSETIRIIAKNSDELLTENGITIYIPVQGSEYAVDTTIPSGTYTVQASDFDNTTSVSGEYILLGVYTGTQTNIKIPNTINYNSADYKVVVKPSVFSGNTTIQYVTFENNVICSQYGHTSESGAILFGLYSHFANCTSLIGVSNVPVNVKILNNTFKNCYSLKFVDNLDKLVNVTNMNACFYMENINQSQLEYIQDLSKLDKCTSLHQTFWNCNNLKRIYGLPNSWNSGTSVFYGCSNLEGDLLIPAGVSDVSYSFAKTKKISSITFLNDEITSITNTMFDEYTNTIKLYANEGSTTKATLESTFASNSLIEIYAIRTQTSTPKIVTWGDSLTSSKADGWVEKLTKRITSHNITNLACSGEFTTSTSVRQGGNTLYTSAFTIPTTTTAVEVTLTSADGYTFGTSPLLSTGAVGYNPVTIAGVKGAITYSNNKYYFTRYEEGNEVSVAPQTVVYSETAEKAKLYDVMVIWLGTNSGWDDVAEKLIAQIDSMVNYFESNKILIMTQASGYRFRTDERRDTAIEIENTLSTKYGNKYLNIRKYLIDNALTENNLTATDVDTTRMSNGRVPASILLDADKINAGATGGDGTDDTHFNNYGQISICNAVYSKLQELGYIS